jgi:short-subunit dehydrogenase
VEPQVALVTGASSGIGWAAARALAAHGFRVAVTARRRHRLDRLVAEVSGAGGEAAAFPADLARPEEREWVVEAVRRHWGRIDVLVNNAGFGHYGPTAEVPWELADRMLAVNIEAVVHLTRLVLPEMLARRSGHLINVASVAGDLVVPPSVLYSATKAFVQAFTEGLYRELRGSGVRVSVVNPGPVRTEFARVSAGLSPEAPAEIERGIPPEEVAAVIVGLVRRPRKRAYVPWYWAAAPWIALLFGWAVDRLFWVWERYRLRPVVGSSGPGRPA